MTGDPQNDYDRVPYLVRSYVQTSPDRLATVARLFGLTCPPVEACRVLELGCGSGWNIIPMAEALPGSVFVGIDYSARQIADGRGAVAELGLSNITLQHMDIRDVGPELGQFDYIIAHGIYSWVPEDVRDHLLRACGQNLAPGGIAYVSYNTNPGWRVFSILRDMLLYHTADVSEPEERAARGLGMLDFITSSVGGDRPVDAPLAAAAMFMRDKLENLGDGGPTYLLHDLMEVVNEPVYFHEFVTHIKQHGLQYVAEAHLPEMMLSRFPAEMADVIRQISRDWLDVEQYMDFVGNRTFRATVLCHQDRVIDRSLSPRNLAGLYVGSRARPQSDQVDIHSVSVERFRSINNATLATEHPVTKAAMVFLGQIWPQAVPFDTLQDVAYGRLGIMPSSEERARDREALGATLLRAYTYSTDLVGLHADATPLAPAIGERPIVRSVVRMQAQTSNEVTNFYHEMVDLDPLTRFLAPLLDGTRDRAELKAAIAAAMAEGQLVRKSDSGEPEDSAAVEDVVDEELRASLAFFSYAGLLAG